ncbi:hypothetical protein LC593_34315 [Nostoc sp. CHAB 5844]|nr:hypothetical protein [Nostoc sp. CHAB 5844]
MYSNHEESTFGEWSYQKYLAAQQRKQFEFEQCYGVDYQTYIAQSQQQKNSEINYEKHPPKPTRYKYQFFRSQLEATWAAFFDKLGSSWEYEPEDAKNYFRGWRTDFKIVIHQEIVYCEVKPLWFRKLPNWLTKKIVDAESALSNRKDNNLKLAILGNAAPIRIENIPSLGYVSVRRKNNQRDWLPFSVNNQLAIEQIWQEAQQIIQEQPGLSNTPILDPFCSTCKRPQSSGCGD